MKVAKLSFLNEKSYNKTVIDFNFGKHKDLSILKGDIHLGLPLFRVDKSLCLPYRSQKLFNITTYKLSVKSLTVHLKEFVHAWENNRMRRANKRLLSCQPRVTVT